MTQVPAESNFCRLGRHAHAFHIESGISPVSTIGSMAWAPFKDLDGDIRLFGGSVSMGADEIPSTGSSLYLPLIKK
jgi:hypothetical protein